MSIDPKFVELTADVLKILYFEVLRSNKIGPKIYFEVYDDGRALLLLQLCTRVTMFFLHAAAGGGILLLVLLLRGAVALEI